MDMPALVPDVLAEWAYSEIVEGVRAGDYVPCRIDELRAKRTQSVPFSQLTLSERYTLARACYGVRTNIFIHLIGVTRFDLVDITRADLADTIVPPHAADDIGRYVSFAEYMTTSSDNSQDARYNLSTLQKWQPPEAPLTFGYIFQHRVLIDGYHRAVRFWQDAARDDVLKAYVPQDAPYATH
jgi:hypothetical protein